MSLEGAFLILRLLAALSLLGFLFGLFYVIWRSIKQLEASPSPLAASYGFLIRQAPQNGFERFTLRSVTTLGRLASNSIVVPDDFVSSEHAKITLEENQWWLEDRGSRNGTRLNDEAISRRSILTDGDVIGIGQYQYRLELNQAQPLMGDSQD